MGKKEEEEMAIAESVKFDVKDSLVKSLEEVDRIRNGKLSKRSYKDMIKRVRKDLDENKQIMTYYVVAVEEFENRLGKIARKYPKVIDNIESLFE